MSTPTIPPRTRDLRLDALRGLLVLFMAVNHVESPLGLFTDQALGYFGAAEGFVFISGLIGGWVYGRKHLTGGFGAACGSTARRAVAVYRAHVFTYLCALLWTALFVIYTGRAAANFPQLFASDPLLALGLGPLLLHQPALFDILPMYCGFLLLLPWVLRAVQRGESALALALTFALWAFTQSSHGALAAWDGKILFGSYHPLAWQVLFVCGAVLGARRLRESSPFRARPLFLVGAAGGAAILWALRHGVIASPLPAGVLDSLADKTTLGVLRMANFALVAYCVAAAVSAFPRAVRPRALVWVGQAALPCFATQALVAFAVLTFPEIFQQTLAGPWIATALVLAAVFATALIRRRQHLRRIELALAHLLRSQAPKPPPRTIANAS